MTIFETVRYVVRKVAEVIMPTLGFAAWFVVCFAGATRATDKFSGSAIVVTLYHDMPMSFPAVRKTLPRWQTVNGQVLSRPVKKLRPCER